MILRNTDIDTLMRKVVTERKRLVCFGAGRQLQDCCKFFEEYDFFDTIHIVLDNVKSQFEYNGDTKLVVNPAQFLESVPCDDDIVILITSLYYAEMFEQLNKCEHLANTECYIYWLIANTPISLEFPSYKNRTRQIPKTIHYTWFGGGEIPQEQRSWLKSWKKYCPDYEIILWNESNYDVSKNTYMYAAYQHKKYSFVSDYARLDIIYNFGGVYLDTDVELLKNIDDLLYDEAFCGFSSIEKIATGLGFGARPKFPLIAEMLRTYDDISFVNENGSLNLADNGAHQTPVMDKYGLKHKNITQMIQGMRVYSTDVLSPVDFIGNPIGFTVNTHSIHHYAASWMGEVNEIYNIRRNCKRFWQLYIEKE